MNFNLGLLKANVEFLWMVGVSGCGGMQSHFILFYFISFYFILFYLISFYFILFYSILPS